MEISSAGVGASLTDGNAIASMSSDGRRSRGAERGNVRAAAANRCNRAQAVVLRKTLESLKIRNAT
jgi:hypothetical protein